MDGNGQNGRGWTEWTEMDRNGGDGQDGENGYHGEDGDYLKKDGPGGGRPFYQIACSKVVRWITSSP